ncbi:MAG: recombination protein RecR [Desulfobacterales bacterium]|nr:MAG: recombination protein RecR [Desulfobacterales bacterium]
MARYPASVTDLIRLFTMLPGVGEKTAERLTMHLVHAPVREAESLARGILHMKDVIRLCRICHGLSDRDICSICENPARDKSLICVVAGISDMAAMENSGAFRGRYHILQGLLSPVDGVGPDDIRIRELAARVGAGGVREIILATGATLEGDATAVYIHDRLGRYPVRISRIAAGVPIGGDLKYVDQLTLRKAMEDRHELT